MFGIKAGGKKMADMLAASGVPSYMYSFDYRGKKHHTMSSFLFLGDDKLPFEPGNDDGTYVYWAVIRFVISS